MKVNKDPLAMVTEFARKMNMPVVQGWEDREGIKLWTKLIQEESLELNDALEDLRIFEDDTYISNECKGQVVKELSDLIYVCYGLAARIGIDINEAFRLVHESNMSKLGDDGKPVLREDGKIMKGPNYHSPDLRKIVKDVPITL